MRTGARFSRTTCARYTRESTSASRRKRADKTAMAEILGLGMTHYPPLAGRDENMMGILKGTLRDPAIPPELKEPSNWPPRMREEYGNDQGKAAAVGHREELLEGMARIRAALDAFKPDFVLIWGDDQYENFT